MYTITDAISSYAATGKKKTQLSVWRMLMLGAMSGIYIAFAGAAANTAIHAIANPGVAKLLNGLVFALGLGIIISTGSELFTGNTLIVISVLGGHTRIGAMLRNLIFVYVGNLIGAVAASALCVYSGQVDVGGGALALYSVEIAVYKSSLPFLKAFLLGVGCNMLVVTAVIVAHGLNEMPGKLAASYVPMFLFIVCGFENCAANMFYISEGLLIMTVPEYAAAAVAAGIDVSALNLGGFFLGNLLPVTLGNAVGGMLIGVYLWFMFGDKAEHMIDIDGDDGLFGEAGLGGEDEDREENDI